MKIAGLQKLTLLDYPGKTAASIFTLGCNFRCPFCHNADLVVPLAPDLKPFFLSEEEFFSFLQKRKGLLDGICITGGEPTLQNDLGSFCKKIKDQGFLVKLDTNGSHPDILNNLISLDLVDYVAMDIKNSPDRYAQTVGLDAPLTHTPPTGTPLTSASSTGTPLTDTLSVGTPLTSTSSHTLLLPRLEKSMRLLLQGSIPFEFRTTVLTQLHTPATLIDTAQWIASLARKESYPCDCVCWFIQQFVDSDTVLAGEGTFSAWDENEFYEILPSLQAILPRTALRGVSRT